MKTLFLFMLSLLAASSIFAGTRGVWYRHAPSVPDIQLVDIAGDGNIFVAVGESGNLMTSTNGHDWEMVRIEGVSGLDLVVWQGVFLAAGTNMLIRSYDGIQWEHISVPDFGNPTDIMWNGEDVWVVLASEMIVKSGIRSLEVANGVEHHRRRSRTIGTRTTRQIASLDDVLAIDEIG